MENKKEYPKCVANHVDCFAACYKDYENRTCKCLILTDKNPNCNFYKTKFEFDMEIPHERLCK